MQKFYKKREGKKDMSKELEALHKLFGLAAYCNENMEGMNGKEMKEYDKKCENMKKIIEQALIQKDKQAKILDILKKKTISNFYIQWTKNYKDYNEFCVCYGTDYAELTQEEYDLLKEWLNDN